MKLSTQLKIEKETKRTVKYVEVVEGPLSNNGNLGTLYIPKVSLPQPFPQVIIVTIEDVTEEVEVATDLEV